MDVQTRAELDVVLQGKTRSELVDLIWSLVSLDKLLSARQIAEACGISKRTVLQAMKAGAFVDPLFGRGCFFFAANCIKVSIRAANAWRRSFFVQPDSITGHKKKTGSDIGVDGKRAGQKASCRRPLHFVTWRPSLPTRSDAKSDDLPCDAL
jgi:hypothetical protein